jgi:radical SAM superfamily enzyme YgiQ (UPF0313 family)
VLPYFVDLPHCRHQHVGFTNWIIHRRFQRVQFRQVKYPSKKCGAFYEELFGKNRRIHFLE